MIFLQLGFYAAVPAAGVLIYDKMRFDILLTSSSYVFQGQPGEFPRRRLQQAEALPDIASVAPVYLDAIQWSVEKDRTRREIFIIGFKLWAIRSLTRQTLIDRSTRCGDRTRCWSTRRVSRFMARSAMERLPKSAAVP